MVLVMIEPLMVFEFVTPSTENLEVIEAISPTFVLYFFDVINFERFALPELFLYSAAEEAAVFLVSTMLRDLLDTEPG